MKWLLNHEVVRPNKERQGITLPVMIHIKRILYPTDLSPFSVNAVQYALTLSRAHDAELILLHGTESLDGKEELLDSVWDGQ
jgi:hypothetical protein